MSVIGEHRTIFADLWERTSTPVGPASAGVRVWPPKACCQPTSCRALLMPQSGKDYRTIKEASLDSRRVRQPQPCRRSWRRGRRRGGRDEQGQLSRLPAQSSSHRPESGIGRHGLVADDAKANTMRRRRLLPPPRGPVLTVLTLSAASGSISTEGAARKVRNGSEGGGGRGPGIRVEIAVAPVLSVRGSLQSHSVESRRCGSSSSTCARLRDCSMSSFAQVAVAAEPRRA